MLIDVLIDKSVKNDEVERIIQVLQRTANLHDKINYLKSIDRLTGGLTNSNYKINIDNQNYVVRLPGVGTEKYIDRKVEMANSTIASDIDVNAKLYYFNNETGTMITKYIDNCDTLHADSFKDKKNIEDVTNIMKKLHTSNKEFMFRFDVFKMIEYYSNLLNSSNIKLPDGYADMLKDLQKINKALENKPVELAPCHNDVLCENFIRDENRVYLIDWEYSGMNDPMFDLGDFSIEANLSRESEFHMLHTYFNGRVPKYYYGKVIMNKVLCDAVWTLWGLIQVLTGKDYDEFYNYAIGRFERCNKLLSSDEFSKCLGYVNDYNKEIITVNI